MKPDPDHAFITHPVVVKDLRGKEDQFSMDVNGFRFLKHKSALGYEDFHDRAKHSTYTKEIEELLKKEYVLPTLNGCTCFSRGLVIGPALTAVKEQEHPAWC